MNVLRITHGKGLDCSWDFVLGMGNMRLVRLALG